MNRRRTGQPQRNRTTFAQAVAAAPPPVNTAYQPGKAALRPKHARQVVADDARLTGSIDLDASLQRVREHAQAHRWDYGLGYRSNDGSERAVWIEVHSAETSEVSIVLNKLRWLRDYLAANCAELRAITPTGTNSQAFIWLASGRVNIPQHMPQRRQLAQAGLDMPRSSVILR